MEKEQLEKLEKLEFSYNWNGKLGCNCFTTIRLSGRFEPGQIVEIWQKKNQSSDVFHGKAVVVDKKALANIDAISNWVAMLDSGYGAYEFRNIMRRMYGAKAKNWTTQSVYYYLLKYIKEDASK